MTNFRVTILTGGGIGVEIARRISLLPGVTLAGIGYEHPGDHPRPLLERWSRNVKYRGVVGAAVHACRRLASRLLPRRPDVPDPDEQALRDVAAAMGAYFVSTSNLHDPAILDAFAEVRSDLGVVVGTTILQPALYELPRLGSINLHGGKVPEYRGCDIVFWALQDGAAEMGITVHQVVRAVDAGPVLLTASVPMDYDYDRFGLDVHAFEHDVHRRLTPPSIDLVVEAVRQLAEGTGEFVPQDDARSVRRRKPTFREQRHLRALLRERHG